MLVRYYELKDPECTPLKLSIQKEKCDFCKQIIVNIVATTKKYPISKFSLHEICDVDSFESFMECLGQTKVDAVPKSELISFYRFYFYMYDIKVKKVDKICNFLRILNFDTFIHEMVNYYNSRCTSINEIARKLSITDIGLYFCTKIVYHICQYWAKRIPEGHENLEIFKIYFFEFATICISSNWQADCYIDVVNLMFSTLIIYDPNAKQEILRLFFSVWKKLYNLKDNQILGVPEINGKSPEDFLFLDSLNFLLHRDGKEKLESITGDPDILMPLISYMILTPKDK